MLESLGFIERYAWFIDNTDSPDETRAKEAQYTYLYDNDDTLSETGKIYKDQISNIPLEITGSLENGQVDKKYNFTFKASGGSEEYTFSNDAPVGVKNWCELPEGLSLSSSGVLSGIPKERGKHDICISVKDSNEQVTFKYFTLVIE